MASLSKGLKSLYYAGVGAGTYCYEAAENVLNKFIEKGKESVTLITCTGEWSDQQQTYLSRQFTRAVLVD